jgi:hypothetical protein
MKMSVINSVTRLIKCLCIREFHKYVSVTGSRLTPTPEDFTAQFAKACHQVGSLGEVCLIEEHGSPRRTTCGNGVRIRPLAGGKIPTTARDLPTNVNVAILDDISAASLNFDDRHDWIRK